jgi:hypothetical protein
MCSATRRVERDEREQEPDVQEQEDAVGTFDLLHERMVIDPDDADREEAHRVGHVRGPDLEETVPEVGRVLPDLRIDVQDQQGRGDREDAVGERLQPTRPHRRGRA